MESTTPPAKHAHMHFCLHFLFIVKKIGEQKEESIARLVLFLLMWLLVNIIIMPDNEDFWK